jgi:hypothetical protein
MVDSRGHGASQRITAQKGGGFWRIYVGNGRLDLEKKILFLGHGQMEG